MKKRRVRLFISGRVQGVYFRGYTRDTARLNKLSGWVRNLRDGRVEAVFEGDADDVEKMIAWCYEGSPHARVDDIEILEEVFSGEFETFTIER